MPATLMNNAVDDSPHSPLDHRLAGILLHPTSLPGAGVVGCFNKEAFRFVDFLAEAGIRVWQVLPLGPTGEDLSPYNSASAFAGSTLFIDLNDFVALGLLDKHYQAPKNIHQHVQLIHTAYAACKTSTTLACTELKTQIEKFVIGNSDWLVDYALFRIIQEQQQGESWHLWPEALKNREPEALSKIKHQYAEKIEQVFFKQFFFNKHWVALKNYANSKNIKLLGDLPIFVAHNGVDVWSHQKQFNLDESGMPLTVAGVPPDYFSETGQRWGNPHYRWSVMAEDEFSWWRRRVSHLLDWFDWVRIDHFRGLEACWEIPADEQTAIHGHWQKAPGDELLGYLQESHHTLPFIAEDLGIITEEVTQLREKYSLPGMKILQFAFDSDDKNPYLPHNYADNCVVYTGTHDNNTALGWFKYLSDQQKARVLEYLGQPTDPMPWPLIRAALASPAKLAIIPMQDILALDERHRMNTPGQSNGSWLWRFTWDQVPDDLAAKLYAWNKEYQRV